jgi:hypothetical protein
MVFRRLAVFPASFDLAAAEAVAGGAEGIDVLDTVVHLVDRSLVQYEPELGRYRLLETLRQYGADRLGEAAETDAVRRRHAEYFLALAARIGPELEDARYVTAHSLLENELDNLRATAEWYMNGGMWAQLWDLARPLWIFLWQSLPVDGLSWCSQLIDHADGLDRQVVVDALACVAYLSVLSFAKYPEGVALAERSVNLAAEKGLEQSPWSWFALSLAGFWYSNVDQHHTSGRSDAAGVAASDRGLAAADARNDELAAVIALGVKANWLVAAGDDEARDATSREALRRAERTGNPIALLNAVTTAAGCHLFKSDRLDFAAALAILEDYDETTSVDVEVAMWLDVQWGAALVGLGRSGAVGRLAHAVRAADRQSALHVEDYALRLLAVAVAQGDCGREKEADLLTGYANANLRFEEDAAYAWTREYLDRALTGVPDRASRQAAGARLTRHEMLAIVNDCEASIASP